MFSSEEGLELVLKLNDIKGPLQTLQTYLRYAVESMSNVKDDKVNLEALLNLAALSKFMKSQDFEIPIQRSRAAIIDHAQRLVEKHDVPSEDCKVNYVSSAMCLYATKGCDVDHSAKEKFVTDAAVIVKTEKRADSQFLQQVHNETKEVLKEMRHEKNSHQGAQSQGEEFGPPGYDPNRVL